MTANDGAQPKPLPGTVFTPRQVHILKRVVIAMGVALVGGFLLLVSVIAYQATQLGANDAAETEGAPAASAALPKMQLPLPAGAQVSHLALDGDRLALHVSGPQGAEIVVVDLRSGRVVSRLRLAPQ